MGIKDSEALPPGIKPESEQAYEIRTQRAEWKRGMSFLAEAQQIMVEAEVQTIEEEQRVSGSSRRVRTRSGNGNPGMLPSVRTQG
jgi:hypothetical protein